MQSYKELADELESYNSAELKHFKEELENKSGIITKLEQERIQTHQELINYKDMVEKFKARVDDLTRKLDVATKRYTVAESKLEELQRNMDSRIQFKSQTEKKQEFMVKQKLLEFDKECLTKRSQFIQV